MPVPYLDGVGHVLTGSNFGISLRDGQLLRDVIGERVSPTVELALALLGLVLSLCIANLVGVISARRPGSKLDSVAAFGALSGVAIPMGSADRATRG